jgi:cytochrome P450
MPEGVRDMPPAPGGSRFARGDDKQDSLRRRVAARYEIEALMRNAIARRVELPLADAVSLMCQGRDGRTETSLSDEELIAQSMMMLAGGDDTTSALATWFFVELGRSPEALTALSNEIDAVIGDGPLTYDAVNSMTYLDCVIKEIERMHSPTLGGVRTVLRQFEFDGYTVPQGWTVRNCAVLSHYLPEVFKDPERFDPARFAPPRSEDVKTPYGLIAFGAGPRHCTGRNFAKLFMRILAIVSVRNAYWTLVPGQDLTPVLDRVFKPRSRLEINFIGRSVATAQTPKPASRTR